jgi:DNA polymerase V
VDFNNGALREKLMVDIDVSEVWGVGRQSAAKLKTLGICSVADLKAQSPKRMQSLLNIQLARIVLELNGTCCYEEDTSKAQQQVMCSRTFSRYLTTLSELRCAVSEYAQRAGEKLRQQQLTASNITVFIRTNPHHRTEAFYERCASITLQHPSSDSISLKSNLAWCCLERMYKTGKHYHECGVLLSGLQATHQAQQGSLFVDYPQARHATLMSTIDQINQRFPKGIQLASSGFDRSYLPKTENKSPSYTTNWQQLVRVKT